MSSFSRTTDGLLKAMHNLIDKAQRDKTRAPRYPRYEYERGGTMIHMARPVDDAVRAEIEALTEALQDDTLPESAAQAILRKLAGYPVKMVRVHRANLLDHSRYPGSVLRKIRAVNGSGKGPDEIARRQARRLARLAPMAEAA